MRRTRRAPIRAAVTASAALLLAAASLVPAATAPAGAQAVDDDVPVDSCGPSLSHTRVEGDLITTNWSCVLDHVVVTGDVRLTGRFGLRMRSSTIKGDVHVSAGGFVAIARSSVWGGIHLTDAARLQISAATVHRSVRGSVADARLWQGDVRGALNLGPLSDDGDRPQIGLFRSQIGGWMNVHGGSVQVVGSTLDRGLTVSGGSLRMCGSTVAADLTARWSHDPVGIGASVFAGRPCVDGWDVPERNAVGGSVVLVDNFHSVILAATAVGGDLECSGNDGGRFGLRVTDDVQVGGTRTGQCA